MKWMIIRLICRPQICVRPESGNTTGIRKGLQNGGSLDQHLERVGRLSTFVNLIAAFEH